MFYLKASWYVMTISNLTNCQTREQQLEWISQLPTLGHNEMDRTEEDWGSMFVSGLVEDFQATRLELADAMDEQ